MCLRDVIKERAKIEYKLRTYKGKPLIDWAILWFKMSNDTFCDIYGFNFNPHEYPMLYEIAREEVYG